MAKPKWPETVPWLTENDISQSPKDYKSGRTDLCLLMHHTFCDPLAYSYAFALLRITVNQPFTGWYEPLWDRCKAIGPRGTAAAWNETMELLGYTEWA